MRDCIPSYHTHVPNSFLLNKPLCYQNKVLQHERCRHRKLGISWWESMGESSQLHHVGGPENGQSPVSRETRCRKIHQRRKAELILSEQLELQNVYFTERFAEIYKCSRFSSIYQIKENMDYEDINIKRRLGYSVWWWRILTWSVIATHRFHQVCLEFEEKRHNSELKFSSAKIGDTALVGKEEVKDTLFKKGRSGLDGIGKVTLPCMMDLLACLALDRGPSS